jgi:hypothetical protein
MNKAVHQNGLWFHPETPAAVRNVLVEAYHEHATLRVWYGDVQTGVAWSEENDVMGRLSRTCGQIKVPLLVAPGEDGAPAMLEHCIVRIDRVTRNRDGAGRKGKTLYAHPNFSTGHWEPGAAVTEGYQEAAYHNGELTAQFKKAGSAKAYCDFMQGFAYATSFH